ncbi:Rrf2 family transcriptional regulator [Ulvibacterium sp.]|uniref:RrF2 family transcriptional regulator n=1 Tax=Ulvibacterium sp. TaxID=2665914 RepID=UPI00262F6807|nr:Rrf2 family transcriptional regulator [Ulvibacterium sp.]
MLSNSSKYALKAVLYLAVHSSVENKILAKDITKPINVPRAYIAKILQELSRHQIVSSTRGPKGGFYLNEENRKTRLIDIISLIDGDNRLTSCVLSLHKCDYENPCPMHHLVDDTKASFVEKLRQTSVEDLILDIKLGKSFLPI